MTYIGHPGKCPGRSSRHQGWLLACIEVLGYSLERFFNQRERLQPNRDQNGGEVGDFQISASEILPNLKITWLNKPKESGLQECEVHLQGLSLLLPKEQFIVGPLSQSDYPVT
ncbi:hypothetical protein B0H10DRAFT_1961075 [Mycena sp. CBHHK59/15]|nr:hypothetical protein B0H10DRAFT_1961075 [Mycena sp. CBHHK59/15]